jgi:hypothetical protein
LCIESWNSSKLDEDVNPGYHSGCAVIPCAIAHSTWPKHSFECASSFLAVKQVEAMHFVEDFEAAPRTSVASSAIAATNFTSMLIITQSSVRQVHTQ